jgi:hypothetical protein
VLLFVFSILFASPLIFSATPKSQPLNESRAFADMMCLRGNAGLVFPTHGFDYSAFSRAPPPALPFNKQSLSPLFPPI